MQRIYLITTGGTIETAYPADPGAVLNSAGEIDQYLKKLRLPDCEVWVIAVMNKGNPEMTLEDRAGLVLNLGLFISHGQPIVITHGTETMVETGLYIKQALPDLGVPVILTGAMKPLGFEGSDGLQNLTESLLAARLLEPGVFVVLHSQVFPIDRVRKDKELGTFVAM
jgi:L-asparaginase